MMHVLSKRLGRHQPKLHPEKTRVVALAGSKGERSSDLLGLKHYMGSSRSGNGILKRKTSGKKFTLALSKMRDWIRSDRHRTIKESIKDLDTKLRGYYNHSVTHLGLKTLKISEKLF